MTLPTDPNESLSASTELNDSIHPTRWSLLSLLAAQRRISRENSGTWRVMECSILSGLPAGLSYGDTCRIGGATLSKIAARLQAGQREMAKKR
jgi:hypothetical protein